MPQTEQPPSIDQVRARTSQLLDSLDPDGPIAATVVFKVLRAKETEFIRNANTLTEATRKLPGCEYFAYYVAIPSAPPNEPAQYAINESWKTVRQFKTQWDSAHLKHFQHTVGDLVAAPPDLQFYHGADYQAEARVPKSGQKRCWDTSGAFMSCEHSGQDGAVQAGAPWPEPRFTDHEDGTVTDNVTGLIWLKNGDRFGEVTWAQALAHAHKLASGSEGLTDGSAEGDWRLPTIKELLSLMDYGTGNPLLPEGHPFTGVKPSVYWTSNSLAAAPTLAWMMTLGIGPTVFDLKVNHNRMWPVRTGGKTRVPKTGQMTCWDTNGQKVDCAGTGQDGETQAGLPSPTPRFLDHGDGTVTDKLTGLVWAKNADAFGPRTWEQALAVCNSLGSGNFGLMDGSMPGDWRLPNFREIESLVDYGQVGPSLPADQPFVNVRPTSYWTSTSVATAPSQAMFIILGVGPGIFENKEHPFFVWPVRNWRPAR
ncbi:MAG TPA: DUF1566 domain-containing protein [Thermoanaerobaculia bacterium]|nr:DUF1566 domain-containing protein [Thermoanaerobaculia bacterium]